LPREDFDRPCFAAGVTFGFVLRAAAFAGIWETVRRLLRFMRLFPGYM
jgi:hypothetical protein